MNSHCLATQAGRWWSDARRILFPMRFAIVLATLAATAALAQDRPAQAQQTKLGHSLHGDAYDTGPREKPWIMQGIGTAHFPISCKPETQQWFDQGNALLHS